MKSYNVEYFKTKSQWLKKRGIGGSDAATIMNKGAWQTQGELYDKLFLKIQKKIPNNYRMKNGVKSEEHIRELFFIHNPQFKAKNPPKKGYWLFTSKKNPLLTLTPDGLAKDKDKKLLFTEFKDMTFYTDRKVEEIKRGIVPEQYLYQVLHYFVVIKEIEYGYLVINANHYTKNDITNEWEFLKSEIIPLKITRENFQKSINELEQSEINFTKLSERPKLKIILGD